MSAGAPVVGVFDSGFGGLTVLRSLLGVMPGARYVYLGDTARLPYGSKSRETIVRYALGAARFLVEQGAELLVVACNTASALALAELKEALPIPVLGVIAPGAQAAAAADASGEVLVLATAATVQAGAYTRELARVGLRATEKACPLLVPLVEEGWIEHRVTAEVVRIYLEEGLAAAPAARTLVLGCTHYPLLQPVMARVLSKMGHPLRIVDAAEATARAAVGMVRGFAGEAGEVVFYATDSVEKFERLGGRFLGRAVRGVRLLDLGG